MGKGAKRKRSRDKDRVWKSKDRECVEKMGRD